jgi:hypothetical protein
MKKLGCTLVILLLIGAGGVVSLTLVKGKSLQLVIYERLLRSFEYIREYSFESVYAYPLQLIHKSTIYYVDFESGSDSNSGESPTNAFKHCPGDTNATERARSKTLFPGDTVVFKGGISYNGTVHMKWSGKSEDKQIVYDGNSNNLFGKGKAIINGEHIRHQGLYSAKKGIEYITIKGFEIKEVSKDNENPLSTCGIMFAAESENVRIEDCYIHDIGIWSNEGKTDIIGNGIKLIHPARCLVKGCEITAVGYGGIYIQAGMDCLILNNNIHDYVNWGIDLAADSAKTSTGNIIRGNIVHDLYHYDVDFWGGKPSECPHQDFVFIRRGDGLRPYNNIVEKNLFYNNYDFQASYGGTAMIFISEADENIIRNNIFINTHSYFAIGVAWGSLNNEIYNNLIYNPRASGIILNSTGSPGGTKIKNNVIIASKLVVWHDNYDEKGWEIDHNYFLTESKLPFNAITSSKYQSFESWQAVSGNDRNGEMLKSTDAFKFVNLNGYPTSCQSMDFHLRPDSPLIDRGIKLPDFSDDYDGVKRPQGKEWDVGPYEFK